MQAGVFKILTSLTLALGWAQGHAAAVTQASPQGEVSRVQQIVVRFDQAVTPLGDPRQPDPYRVRCQGAVPAGQGRWLNDRQWVYDFEVDLPPGVRCEVQPVPGWKPPVAAAGTWSAPRPFTFQTGGPIVTQIEPGGGEIDEQQHWLLTLNGVVGMDSLAGRAWCEVEGMGERVPLQPITGASRDAVLRAQGIKAQTERRLLVRCQRPLPARAAVRVVWGPGIAAKALPQAVTRQAQTFTFRVRDPFEVSFSCEREKAQAPCLPLRPITVQLSSPVARAVAEKVRIERPQGDPLKPWFEADDRQEEVQSLTFSAPLPENTALRLVLPADMKDSDGRPVANAHAFPRAIRVGAMPPLAKFAAAPFGVIELDPDPEHQPMLPLTVRQVEARLGIRTQTAGQRLSGQQKTLSQDLDILRWMAKVRAHHETSFTARDLGRPASQWQEWRQETDEDGRVRRFKVERRIGARELSLLKGEPGTRPLTLPPPTSGAARPFEVIGLPLPGPGYHVVEIESPRLGAALLARPAPMYVRTGVLVTNLGVHVKLGREASSVWVTTLDKATPVAGADVAISDCRGQRLWQGRTDVQGLALVKQALPVLRDETCLSDDGLFVSARKTFASGPYKGRQDLAFTLTDWHRGIEPWRFNLPTASPAYGPSEGPELRVHTVTDRALLRAGETVSMKHFMRLETQRGLARVPRERWPSQLRLVHVGQGDEISQAVAWRADGTALSSWTIPTEARLGVYDIQLLSQGPEGERRHTAGRFRVEEFRLPLVQAQLSGPATAQISPAQLPLSAQLSFLSGGGFGGVAARVSALVRERDLRFPGYDDFSFQPSRALSEGNQQPTPDDEPSDDEATPSTGRLVADRLPVVTDRQGQAKVILPALPPTRRPMSLQAELTFNDPNGEVQTASTAIALWPSEVVTGIKASSWASTGGKIKFQALALDIQGKPRAGQTVRVVARVTRHTSTRQRIVGGFYRYDDRVDVRDLGEVCSGKTDSRGLLLCDATIESAGEIELVAQAQDGRGRTTESATTVWVTRHGELWFSQDNDDRMDVLPERTSYEPGETARLQVRMPFRRATVLVSVEREGVIDQRVMTLEGDDPTIDLPIPKASSWAPNVFVSVLAVRGRVHEVPWYSFFTWGWRQPLQWWQAFRGDSRDYQAPTALVDLSRPAFKLGVAQLTIGRAAHRLDVQVSTDKPRYSIRQTVRTRVRVTHQGRPVQGEIALAAVDEALLTLADNPSWQLLDGLLQPRPWGVETSTAHSEIIGRRHYGRKAAAPGGGGGHTPTRELFDTLLLWRGQVTLNARGEAVVEVPLNDSLTSFRLVAIAHGQPTAPAGAPEAFGTGHATVAVSQDLQMLSGLPPLVREGDRFDALVTLRNTTGQPMTVRAELQGQVDHASGTALPAITLAPQELTLPPQSSRELRWPVSVPPQAHRLRWQASVRTRSGPAAADRLSVSQEVQPAVPLRVWQASLQALEGSLTLPVQAPAGALMAGTPPGVTGAEGARPVGHVQVGVQPRLTGALPGLRRFFETYPFVCLEQQVSKAVGLHDPTLWGEVGKRLPGHLDREGLALYFPPSAFGSEQGSDRLTAYILAVAHEAGWDLPARSRDHMLDGLTAFVEGRLLREGWSPARQQALNLTVRKLSAIDALSRYQRAEARMLESLTIAPQQWPTAAVIDWLGILQRVQGIPRQAERLAEADNILRGRLAYAGSTLRFSTESDDFWWWLMDSPDANAARLILAVMTRPGWQDELPRLVTGSLGRQRQGAWLTTTANLWGSLALDKFSRRFESSPVTGATVASLGGQSRRHDWAARPDGGAHQLPWPASGTAPSLQSSLTVQQQGGGRPWVSVQTLAAVPLKAPLNAGYRLQRQVSIVEGHALKPLPTTATTLPRGTLLRVRLTVHAQGDMTWVALNDPIPAGATVLGSGLGRDSALATRLEDREGLWPVHVERRFDVWRAYFDWLPKGQHTIEYTVRLNNPGRFQMPPSRIEAMYAPDIFGEAPNAVVEVGP